MKRLIPYITVVFFAAVSYLFIQTLSSIDWNQVQRSLSQFSPSILIPALALAALDYFVLANYDYIGFRYLKIDSLKYHQILVSAFSCYAFTQNLGAMVGGVGLRFRIYSGLGISKKIISKIIIFSTLSNWSGHALFLSMFFCFKSQEVYNLLGIPIWILKILGTTLLVMTLIYFILCFKRYTLSFKKIRFIFPSPSLAFLQYFLSCSQWTLISFIIYILIWYLGYDVAFDRILFTSLMASIAGVLTHIPGGLGVLETIFLKVDLGIPQPDMLAVLICYRFVYYFIPLIFATPCLLWPRYLQKFPPHN